MTLMSNSLSPKGKGGLSRQLPRHSRRSAREWLNRVSEKRQGRTELEFRGPDSPCAAPPASETWDGQLDMAKCRAKVLRGCFWAPGSRIHQISMPPQQCLQPSAKRRSRKKPVVHRELLQPLQSGNAARTREHNASMSSLDGAAARSRRNKSMSQSAAPVRPPTSCLFVAVLIAVTLSRSEADRLLGHGAVQLCESALVALCLVATRTP